MKCCGHSFMHKNHNYINLGWGKKDLNTCQTKKKCLPLLKLFELEPANKQFFRKHFWFNRRQKLIWKLATVRYLFNDHCLGCFLFVCFFTKCLMYGAMIKKKKPQRKACNSVTIKMPNNTFYWQNERFQNPKLRDYHFFNFFFY